jgi:hypothetical protein
LVLDGLRPDVLRAAIRDGNAPNLAALAEAGEERWDAISVFPSITPAATAAIATGEPPAGSGIVGHSWYDRVEGRIIVYGAMRETVVSSGPLKVFHNNVWRMNRDHLLAPTVFEELHEHGVEGACVNFPVRRGPHRHPVRLRSVEEYSRYGAYLGDSVDGPREYYMGDLFYSGDGQPLSKREAGGLLRSVGINDEYAARVGATFLREKRAPLNLVYFFKGDSITHHHGLAAQRRWVATADSYVGRILRAGGGAERVLEEYAVLALSDHGHTPLLPGNRRFVSLPTILGEGVVSGPRASLAPWAEALVVPNGRAASIYIQDEEEAAGMARRLTRNRGVDLASWREGDWVVARRLGREIRFRPGSGAADPTGRAWDVEGDERALDMEISGSILYGEYPDALGRLWGCLRTRRCGEVVLSATPGYTFGEVSGRCHTRSDHGSLHASDSNVFVISSGIEVPQGLTEVTPALISHFTSGRASRRAS